MNKLQGVFSNRLAAAEANSESAFSVLEKIQDTASSAAIIASDEEAKALAKRDEYAAKAEEMSVKRSFYLKRSKKISDFIRTLND